MCFSRNFCAMFAKTAFASISQGRDRKWSVSDRAAGLIKTHRPSMQGGIYARGGASASKKCYFFVFLSEQTTRACVSVVVTKSEMSKLLATFDGVKSLRSEISSSEQPRASASSDGDEIAHCFVLRVCNFTSSLFSPYRVRVHNQKRRRR